MSSNPRQNFVTHGRHKLEILSTAPTRNPSLPPSDKPNSNQKTTMDPEGQQKFMYMFERLCVPLFMGPRGTNNNFYNMPTDGMTEKEKTIMTEMRKNLTTDKSQNFEIRRPRKMPDLTAIGMACPRQEHFSFFLPAHREAAAQLSNILMDESLDMDELMNVAAICRDSPMINSHLWLHVVVGVAFKRKEMKGMKMPAVWEVMPDLCLPTSVKRMAEQQAQLPMKSRSIILVNGPNTPRTTREGQELVDITTGRNENPENKLAYFREDLGIASHHWHWHIIYQGDNRQGTRDRRGELFYYMHHNMVARYEAERLSNGLPRVRPLDIASAPVLEEGYFSKLSSQNSGENWGSRQEVTQLRAVSRTDGGRSFHVGMEDIRKWKDRISDAIDTGVVLTATTGRRNLNDAKNTTGPEVELDKGIDILGNLIESAESYSLNMQFYGNLHNMGHVIIAYAHDPEKRHNEKIGPMGAEATAVRDPAFFRWHKFIDDLFDKYKQTLLPYREEQLVWKKIRLTGVSVQTDGLKQMNHLMTNLRWSDVDLSRGLDLGRTSDTMGEIWARIAHLDHLPFKYEITVRNELEHPVKATIRIFMAPRFNEQGERYPMTHQRHLFIEMDKFAIDLRVGNNVIPRLSSQSSVTIPWEQSFRDLEKAFTTFRARDKMPDPSAREAVCGCGWPDHLLLPRGTATGMIFDLFVMVTDGSKDQLPRSGGRQTEGQRQNCTEGISYCGILDSKYPDLMPMGFPFDRNPRMILKPGMTMPVIVSDLDEFIPGDSNMRTIQVTVTHNEKDIRMRENANGAPAGMEVIMSQSVMEQLSRDGKLRAQNMQNNPRPNDMHRGRGQGFRGLGGRSEDEDDYDYDEDENY